MATMKGNNLMASKTQTFVIRGKAMYAKILGEPIPNYDKSGKEWKMDLQLTDKNSLKELKAAGIGDRVKTKDNYLDGSPFMSFRQAEYRKDGVTKNEPIKIVDAAGKPWDDNKLIGNQSDVDVKFVKMDFGPGKKPGVYIRAVRVLNLVPYEKDDFGAITEDDEFFQEAVKVSDEEFAKDFGLQGDVDDLDDELPM